MKKLAIFDIDGTIFRKNLHFELIDELSWLRIFSKDARKTLVRVYADWLEHRGTYEEYRKKIVSIYERELKGCCQKDIVDASRKVADFNKDRVYIFTRDLIKKLKKTKYTINNCHFRIPDRNRKGIQQIHEIRRGFWFGL